MCRIAKLLGISPVELFKFPTIASLAKSLEPSEVASATARIKNDPEPRVCGRMLDDPSHLQVAVKQVASGVISLPRVPQASSGVLASRTDGEDFSTKLCKGERYNGEVGTV